MTEHLTDLDAAVDWLFARVDGPLQLPMSTTVSSSSTPGTLITHSPLPRASAWLWFSFHR